jgi:hypothetical protein
MKTLEIKVRLILIEFLSNLSSKPIDRRGAASVGSSHVMADKLIAN